MNLKKNLVLISCAFALIIGILIVGRILMTPRTSARQPVIRYYIAKQDLPRGQFIETAWVEAVPLRQEQAGANIKIESLLQNSEASLALLEGSVPRDVIPAGSYISQQDIIKPGDSDFMAAVLKPGKRAVAIQVDDVTGGAGFIRPGNMVDVVLSGKFGTDDKGNPEATAKTLLDNVRVLAVDKDMGLRNAPAAQSTEKNRRISAPKARTNGTVTLEVLPRQVEAIAVGKTIGELSLSLRSLDGSGINGAALSGETKVSDIIARTRANKLQESSVNAIYGTNTKKHTR